jgi:hypothetical protein
MGITVEAIVCPFSLKHTAVYISADAKIILRELDSTSCVLFLPDEESDSDHGLSEFVKFLSANMGKSLLIQYNDHVGYRSSELYESGVPTASFGPDEEIWVEVNEDYQPLPQNGMFRVQQLDVNSDKEYVTYRNAIQLGLEKIGVAISWENIIDIVCDG